MIAVYFLIWVDPGPRPGPWAQKLAHGPDPGQGPVPILGPRARAHALDPPKPKSAKNKLFHLLVNLPIYYYIIRVSFWYFGDWNPTRTLFPALWGQSTYTLRPI